MKKDFDTQLFAQAMAACTEGLVIADATAPDMPLVYVNAAFERLTGYSAREVLGSNCRFLQRGDTDQIGLALVRAALENGEPCVVTVRNYRKDGSAFWNELSLSPIHGSGGAVTHFLGKLDDVSERVTAEQKLLAQHKQLLARKRELEHLALRDGLTGLYNRRAFDEQLEREWNRARRDQTPLSLIMIDIDHFKQYNDTFGHPAGDRCIQEVASVLQRCFARGSDLVARYGGDEFVVLACAIDRNHAEQHAEQLRQTIKTLGFAGEGHATAPPISLSIGVATTTPLQSGTPEDLLHAADRALYQAKRRQHDRFEEPAPTYTSRARIRGAAHPPLSTSA